MFLGTEKLILEKDGLSLGKVLIQKIWTKRFSSFPLFASHAVQDALLDLNCGLCTSRMPIGYSGRTGFPNKTFFLRGEKVADFFRQTGSDGLKWEAGPLWRFLDIKHKE